MESWKLGLTINGKWYDWKNLLQFSSHQIVSVINPWEKEIYRFIINWLSDQEEIIQYSSGTTGKPKEIRLKKTSMMQSARVTCSYLKIPEGSTSLLCMPVDYIAGKMMIVRSMVCNLDLMIIEPRSTPEIKDLPEIHFSAMVPLQVLNLFLCGKSIEKIRKLLVGGAETSTEIEGLLSKVNTEAYATYGMAETSSHIAMRRLNGVEKDELYRVMPGVQISADNRQCLVIRAPWITGEVVTNDIIEIHDANSFRWLGRHDNLINSGGVKIVPEEVEYTVRLKTGKECIAIGLPDPKFGQRLVFAMEKDQVTGSTDDLKSEFASILPRRWKPSAVIVVPTFPRNEALKIDRRKLLSIVKKQIF